MKTAGIIVEYNPFHNGHAWHIEKTRQQSNADFVIAVMSGDFVQRGEPALLDKYTRTRMALQNGVDLVLELPVCFAAGSAGDFAAGSVSLLDKLGVVDTLCFGSECGDIAPFLQQAILLADEPAAFSAALQESLKQGLSFPQARAAALAALLPADAAALSASPNNLLGLEYVTALLRRNSRIRPLTIPREGAGYHETQLPDKESAASALAIRRALGDRSDWARISPLVPAGTAAAWQHILQTKDYLFASDLTRELRYCLLSREGQDLTCYADVTRELSCKIQNAGMAFSDWDSLCHLLKSRELTYSRISRCLCHILLSVTREELLWARDNDYAPYARILGFRREAAPLLSSIKKSSEIPLLSKLADASGLLSKKAQGLLMQDIRASHIRESALAAKTGALPRNEFQRQIVIL